MTVLELSQSAPPCVAPTQPLGMSVPLPLSASEAVGVVARHSTMSLIWVLDDGRRTFTRERYSSTGAVLYVAPSRRLLSHLGNETECLIEGDVSEVDGLRAWRYVSMRGVAGLRRPTGSREERDDWRQGVEELRRVIHLPSVEELQFANFGVLRVDHAMFSGTAVRIDVDDVFLSGLQLA